MRRAQATPPRPVDIAEWENLLQEYDLYLSERKNIFIFIDETKINISDNSTSMPIADDLGFFFMLYRSLPMT